MNSGQRLGGVGASDHDDKLPQGLQARQRNLRVSAHTLAWHLEKGSSTHRVGIHHVCPVPQPWSCIRDRINYTCGVPLAIEWRRRRV